MLPDFPSSGAGWLCISTWALSSLTSTPLAATAPSTWSPTTTAPAGWPGHHSQTLQLLKSLLTSSYPLLVCHSTANVLNIWTLLRTTFLESLLSAYLCLILFSLSPYFSLQRVRKRFLTVPEVNRLSESRGM